MAKMSAKAAVIMVDDSGGTPRNISNDCISYEIEYGVDPIEVTGFSDTSHNFIPGQRIIGLTLECLWNTAASTGCMTVLYPIVAHATSKTVMIIPEGTGLNLAGEYMLEGITPSGDPASAIKLGSCKFSVMGSTAPTWSTST